MSRERVLRALTTAVRVLIDSTGPLADPEIVVIIEEVNENGIL